MNIILIGFKAVGKTTYGRELENKTNLKFVDIDNIIVEKDNKKRKCREIYSEEGKESFRNKENEALKSLEGKDNLIIATGGGILEKEENKKMLKSLGKVVLLLDNPNIIFKRIEKIGFPEYIDKDNPKESFNKIYNERNEKYSSIADIKIDCVNKEKNKIIQNIIGEIGL